MPTVTRTALGALTSPVPPNRRSAAAVFALMLGGGGAEAAVCTATDTSSLSACINGADATIGVAADITLSAELPPIDRTLTVEGNDKTISGDGLYRALFVKSGTVVLRNLTIAEGKAQGGTGVDGGIGGVGELVGHEGVGLTPEQRFGLGNGALHPFAPGCQNQLRA